MQKTKAKSNSETKIGEAILRVAARQGWNRLTLDAVAKAAKIPAPHVKKLFSDKNDLLPVLVRTIDSLMAAAISPFDQQTTPHDRLFEIMMVRIDILQSHRRTITGIMDAAKRDPRIIRKLLPAQAKTMSGILDFARLSRGAAREPLAIAGLLGVYGLTLCVWRNDSSPDMSRTMAALDRYLRRAVTLSEIIFRPKSRL